MKKMVTEALKRIRLQDEIPSCLAGVPYKMSKKERVRHAKLNANLRRSRKEKPIH